MISRMHHDPWNPWKWNCYENFGKCNISTLFSVSPIIIWPELPHEILHVKQNQFLYRWGGGGGLGVRHSHVKRYNTGMCRFDDPFSGPSAAPETHLFTPSVNSYALRFLFFEKKKKNLGPFLSNFGKISAPNTLILVKICFQDHIS